MTFKCLVLICLTIIANVCCGLDNLKLEIFRGSGHLNYFPNTDYLKTKEIGELFFYNTFIKTANSNTTAGPFKLNCRLLNESSLGGQLSKGESKALHELIENDGHLNIHYKYGMFCVVSDREQDAWAESLSIHKATKPYSVTKYRGRHFGDKDSPFLVSELGYLYLLLPKNVTDKEHFS